MKPGLVLWLRHIPVAATGLLALYALYKMEGASVALPIWAGLVIVSVVVPIRLPDSPAVLWLARIPIFGFAVLSNMSRTVDTVNMFDTRTMTWFGELCAAELAIACWVEAPLERPSTRPLWLAGLILLAASSTQDDVFITSIAVPFFFSLLVALRANSAPVSAGPPARPAVPWGYFVALACALAGGGVVSAVLTTQRAAITAWGMQLLGEHLALERGAISINPTLTSTFGQRGSMIRAMRIDGDGEFSHLRGVAYTSYNGGNWAQRRAETVHEDQLTTELEPIKPGRSVVVTRFLNNRGIVFAPINAAGLHFADGAPITRLNDRGGMIISHVNAPSQYEILLADNPDFQGPLCIPPTASERQRLLIVPNGIDPRVRRLGADITRGLSDPRRRIEAIQQYLISNHSYSLRVDIGGGDRVSNFLLQHKSAHCEYFASAAAILARIAGVPSRYVIGYLAHERDGRGATIVRQRDAHAWAECWIQGTGWVVLDATPGDGRPDSLDEAPSPITAAIERLEDMFTALRLGSHPGGLLKFVAVGLGIIVAAGAVRMVWVLWRSRKPRAPRYRYAASDAVLAALLRDFERASRAYGMICPPDRTWSEFLDEYGAATVPAEQIEAAREFVRGYNAARFGERLPPGELEPLRHILSRFKSARTGAHSADLRRR